MTALVTEPALSTPEACEANDVLYEVVDGQVEELPPMAAYSSVLASMFVQLMGTHAKAHQLGRVMAEVLLRINRDRKLQRRPDVAFVSYERWPKGRRVPERSAWDVVPDLAVEVVSPSDVAYKLIAKIREYFEAGVRRVWVVFPEVELVYDYESATSVRILGRGDELDGEPVVPGFKLPLATLFEEGAGTEFESESEVVS